MGHSPDANSQTEVNALARLQTEMRQTEQRFHAIFEQAAVGMALVALDGQWLQVNSKLCDIVGYSRTELLQCTFQDITYADDLETDLNYVRQLLANEISTYTMEKRYIRKDGTLTWIQLTASLARDEQGTPLYFISVVEDINKRKRIEEAWKRLLTREKETRKAIESERKRLYQLFMQSPAMICLLQGREHVFEFANTLYMQYVGRQDLIGKSLREVLPELKDQHFHELLDQELLDQVYNSGKPFIGTETKVWFDRHLEGTREETYVNFIYYPSRDELGEVDGILIHAVDVTEQVQAREEIRQSRSRLELALEQNERINQSLKEFNTNLESIVMQRTEELNKANEELNKTNKELQRSNQELQDFAYVASHDLQEPLRKIQAFGNVLEDEYGAVLEEGKTYLDRMRKAASRMQILINDLLIFSRVTTKAQPFYPVNLGTIAQEVVEDLEASIQATQGTIEIGELPTIEADALQMRQMLQNLIGNALKFHKSGVAPHVRVYAEEGNDPETGDDGSRPYMRLYVADNGIGFDEKYLDRIFTVFQRLHGRNEYEGTGIGLAVVRKIVERHGGTINARSTIGEGSTFIATLPMHH